MSSQESVFERMRGSTAGFADTLASGPHGRLLATADVVFASLLLAPAVVSYWKSTWTLMDLYLLPDRPIVSAAICAGFGLISDLLMCVFQSGFDRLFSNCKEGCLYFVCSRLYTWFAGSACVAGWRGVWNLLNECTGDSARTLLSTTVAATLSLAALRALRNVCAAPFAIAIDARQDYFNVPTMFRTVS